MEMLNEIILGLVCWFFCLFVFYLVVVHVSGVFVLHSLTQKTKTDLEFVLKILGNKNASKMQLFLSILTLGCWNGCNLISKYKPDKM